jgi:hypothetical protein
MIPNPIPGYESLQWCPVDVDVAQVAWIRRYFSKVWEAIPSVDRASICDHWDRCRSLPVVQLWRRNPQRQGKPPAQTIPGGYGLSIDLVPLSRFPKEYWIELVIAEELAHNFLFATRAKSHTLTEPDDPGDLNSHLRAEKADASREKNENMERDAVAVLVRWQFSQAEHEAAVAWGRRTNWGDSIEASENLQ